MIDASTTAWIFLAVYFWDKSPVSRLEILHSADAINYAVPDDSELELVLRHLTEQGLIERTCDSFALSESGLALAISSDKGPANLYETMKTLETYFRSGNAA